LLANAAQNDWPVIVMGVQTAFLKVLDQREHVFVKRPPWFDSYGTNGPPLVMMFTKSLYGHKQAPNIFISTVGK